MAKRQKKRKINKKFMVTPEFKRCHGYCKKILSMESFCKDRSARNGTGRNGRCRTCASLHFRKWIERNPEKYLQYNRKGSLKSYNLTLEEYLEKSKKQNHVCAVCGKPETVVQAGTLCFLSVDHDHKCCPGKTSCGKCVRDLLCQQCNRILGSSHEDIELLEKIIGYIKRHSNGGNQGDSRTN